MENRERLEADDTVKEVQLAIYRGVGKALGVDGLPSKFNTYFMELLAPKLTSLLFSMKWNLVM